MSSSKLQRWAAAAACASSLALSAGAAQAVVYSSVFDPPNFRGVATFDVADACLSVGTGSAFNGSGGCTITWLSASITFTDGPDFTFDYSSLLPNSGIVSEIWVEDFELAGVISGALGPVEISGAPNPSYNGPWWIQFQFQPPSPLTTALDGPPSSGEFDLGVVYLYGGACFSTGSERFCVRNETPVETAQVESFTRVSQVPEPGTLVLALGGLVAAGLARRRRTTLQ